VVERQLPKLKVGVRFPPPAVAAESAFMASKTAFSVSLSGFWLCIETAFLLSVLSRDMPQKTPDLLESAETGAETIFRLSVSFVPCFI
jgi:hypothetical protein